MSERILSQEEIDALLSAMDSGEVNLELDEKGEVQVKPYDLTSQGIMLRDQFSALEEVYDKFTSLLRTSLSSSLQKSIDVQFVSREMVKFGDFIKAFSTPTSFTIFNMEPLIGSALIAIEPNLVFSLIDCMFGGDGRPLNHVRDFTLVEQRMMRKFAVEVLKELAKAWEIVYSVRISLKKTEIKPEFVHMVAPNELVITIVFSVSGNEFSGNIHLCFSYLMLEPIKDKLSSRYLRERDMEHTWNSQLKGLLRDTPVTLIAELGRTTQCVRELLNLKVEDVVKLNTGPEDAAVITIEGVPKYLGIPGIVKGNRAVQIKDLFDRDGGMDSHGNTR